MNNRSIKFYSSKPNIDKWNTITWNGYHYEPVLVDNNIKLQPNINDDIQDQNITSTIIHI